MNVVEVLTSVKTEVETTHWCQGHYTYMQAVLGPEAEVQYDDKDRPIFKVQHCLMGMVNAETHVAWGTAADSSGQPPGQPLSLWSDSVDRIPSPENVEFVRADEENVTVWEATVNSLGLAISQVLKPLERGYGNVWDSEKRLLVPTPGIDGGDVQGIEGWNDIPGRTRDDIIEVIELALAAETAKSA